MNTTKMPFGTMSTGFNAVFVWFYAKNCNPYAGYTENTYDVPCVNLVLAQVRFDSRFGACGGAVERDETLEDAAEREVLEEVGYNIDRSRLKPMLCLKTPSGSHCHSFSYEVSYDELKAIRDNASTGTHFEPECAGVNLLHISRYSSGRGVEIGYNFLVKQNWVGTSKEELEYLVQKEGLLISYLQE